MDSLAEDLPVYECFLEKKPRGRGFSRFAPKMHWDLRYFILRGQQLTYQVDMVANSVRGSIPIEEALSVEAVNESECGKPYAFAINLPSERILLVASSNDIRNQCIQYFDAARTTPYWRKGSVNPLISHAAQGSQQSNGKQANTANQATQQQKDKEKVVQETYKASVEKYNAESENLKTIQKELKAIQETSKEQTGNEAQFLQQALAAKHIAARLIQSAWASHKSYIDMKKVQALRYEILKNSSAKKLQRAFRNWVARAKAHRELARKASTKIQTFWRICIAQRLLNILRKNRRRLLNLSATTLQKYAYRWLARRRVDRLRRKATDTVFVVRVLRAPKSLLSKLPGQEEAAINLYASGVQTSGLTSADGKAAAAGPGVLNSAAAQVLGVMGKAKLGSVVSSTLMSVSPNFQASEGNFVAGINDEGFVVLTFVDKTDCLGQCIIAAADHPELFRGQSITVTLLLHEYVVKTVSDLGLVPSLNKTFSGIEVTVSLELADRRYNTSAVISKMTDKFMAAKAFKPRFMVIHRGNLLIFDSERELHSVKHFTAAEDVSSITVDQTAEGEVISIAFGGKQPTTWKLKWGPSVHKKFCQEWMVKLYRNCRNVPDPLLRQLGVIRSPVKSPIGDTSSAKSSVPRTPPAGLAMKKRSSIFS